MKIVKELPKESEIQTEKQRESDTFFEGIPPELFQAVCRGLDAQMHPMALVSQELMVVRQTDSCRNLLENASFYSIEGVLRPSECDAIRQSMQSGTEHTIIVTIFEQTWNMRIIPSLGRALLVFFSEQPRQVGVSLAAAHLRGSASRLLLEARKMEQNGQPQQAQIIRREAMRILKEANHAQTLSGAPEPLQKTRCSADSMLARAAEQLVARGVHIYVRAQKDVPFAADEEKLTQALMALVSNSLHYGGAHVHVTLSAEQAEDSVIFGVDDDGPGLSADAMVRMNDTWRRPDAAVGGWGLGIPYARRIAELHGGVLVFINQNGCGCAARIRLPLESGYDVGLESDSSYRGSLIDGVREADIELSDVLEPNAYSMAR